jgi:hypothetical protein
VQQIKENPVGKSEPGGSLSDDKEKKLEAVMVSESLQQQLEMMKNSPPGANVASRRKKPSAVRSCSLLHLQKNDVQVRDCNE